MNMALADISFLGEPPDNAGHFISWLNGLQGKELEGVKYSGRLQTRLA
jgi:cytochrome P450/NADPH-cytochrome P450 reductase